MRRLDGRELGGAHVLLAEQSVHGTGAGGTSIAAGEAPVAESGRGAVVWRHRGKQIAPKGVATFNPAFDVTPFALITGIGHGRGVRGSGREKGETERIG